MINERNILYKYAEFFKEFKKNKYLPKKLNYCYMSELSALLIIPQSKYPLDFKVHDDLLETKPNGILTSDVSWQHYYDSSHSTVSSWL